MNNGILGTNSHRVCFEIGLFFPLPHTTTEKKQNYIWNHTAPLRFNTGRFTTWCNNLNFIVVNILVNVKEAQ